MVEDAMTNYDSNDEEELFEHYKIEVDQGQKPLRVDKYLVNRIDQISRNRIQTAADAGSVRVNDEVVKANYKVKPGDVVTIMMDYPRRELKIIPEDIPLDIVYEDDDLVVVNKQPGMVVHPGHGNYTGTLVNALAYRYKDLPMYNNEDTRPGLVHRIDKNTSGLLVVAKNEHAKTHLSKQFFDKTTKRRYYAIVWGDVKEEEGTVVGNIGRSLKNRQVFTVFPEGDYGKHAVTHYSVVERLGYVNLVECVLETGRTHQIRVHMKHIGHTLFNDDNYGGDKILKGTTFTKYKQFVQNCFDVLPRQALHAQMLGFIHPTTGEEMVFDSPIPEDMAGCIDRWRNYIANRGTE
ncbi:RluA family pseudouridine synthase [Halosquirtibacter xylanolyticus]|uniref:RluA family pseudouridine synthase n=1 Tax=Halosquirtibacter xylanolyticus TaxID=3374599 RepID=UPI00374A37C0|nr:RluA family pseudouridine synthase [Prolixibacteraceae bacterium]